MMDREIEIGILNFKLKIIEETVNAMEKELLSCRKCCNKRGERMEIMRDWLRIQAAYSTHGWDVFCTFYPGSEDWFDKDGEAL